MMTSTALSAKQAILNANALFGQADNTKLNEVLDLILPFSDFICRGCERYPEQVLKAIVTLISHERQTNDIFDTQDSNALSMGSHKSSLLASLQSTLQDCSNEAQMHTAIRIFRHVNMIEIAAADILHLQDIRTSMHRVSELADCIIERSYQWLHNFLSQKHGSPENDQQLQLIAMGKLGGSELNFSSDIDLIFTYPHTGCTQGDKKPIEHQVFFTRLAQKLIQALDQITDHGRCYRVDMRLRPMGDSGPLVIPFAAFETYYQEQGRAWERFAMQKMRIINHNPHSDELYSLIKPFVYRKYMDFTTLDSIREMKVLIEKEVRRRQLKNNIKLGRGGIREIEFFTQALQLIHAGREPDCQQLSTQNGLKALFEHGFIDKTALDELTEAYRFLRTVEHYLQIFNDEQTQTLPNAEVDQKRLTLLLNKASFDQCIAQIDAVMSLIHKHFRNVIDDANAPPSEIENAESSDQHVFSDLWDLPLTEHETQNLLAPLLQNTSIEILYKLLSDFKNKLQTASVSERGMKSINRLMPLLLNEFEIEKQTLNHNQVTGIFGLLSTIIGRITYIDLLLENPAVRQRLFSLSKKSPWVIQQITLHPILLDELLHPVYLKPDDSSLSEYKDACAQELKQFMLRIDPDDIEEVMDALRQFKHAYQLRIAASDISATLAINKVSDKLTVLAEVIIAEVVEQAWRQITLKHGVPDNQSASDKGFGIVAYGKFGGLELSYGSDLDIVCLYQASKSGHTDESGARKSISHQEFYIKLVQKITHYCITKTYHGILYDIDLRLRPSGNSGLLISHIDSFAEYQMTGAWTWEHQALVRARLIFGHDTLGARFAQLRANTLGLHRQQDTLREDVREMREKMRQHLNRSTTSAIDIKQCNGGIVDIEFLVQYWVLRYCEMHPRLSEWSDNLRILEACKDSNIISEARCAMLQSHYLWMRHLAHRLQLSERDLAEPSEQLSEIQNDVSDCFDEVLGTRALSE
ncbi:bifunctional [glutamate--ammonia ligase]-adenylyl-L-tyrosine phosphorylase/[glutamate--ammonia-ligase] adenylyltransferase [Glaciecola siphonariae]|uniref:Bifunctional glutamine synthetase adenylyltransferase/adenylyl-removing enzyme n=1 Tax=Glaciecola siphonariae TaxID=521012 RepID=A0ABV9LWZ1_9ALTE